MNDELNQTSLNIQFDIEEGLRIVINDDMVSEFLHYKLNLLIKLAKQEVLNEITSKINAINGGIDSIITKQI